jgi:pimeloyl-ACP methyl ester carboxylesterase
VGTAPKPLCASPSDPVRHEGFVAIGGIEQWVTVTGERCSNPVILFLHGGPGNPLSPYSDVVFGSWRDEFTLVQWDQRGAGRTFARSRPLADSTLSVRQMTDDGVALTEYLVRRFNVKKIVLVGGSWGSVLGIHMVKARPDLFEAYIGFAQVVASRENELASYRAVAEAAKAAGDARTVAALAAMGAPPWKNPRNFGVLRRATRAYEARTADPPPATWWVRAPRYDTPAMRQDDTAGEDYSYLQYVGLAGDGIFAGLDLYALGPAFDVPMLIVQGVEDLVTRPEVTTRYFNTIVAPRKELVLVPRVGHDPNRRMLDAMLTLLHRHIRR